MASMAAAMSLAACGNETRSAPPDTVTPADAVLYAEIDLTLAEDQEEGLAALVKAATGEAPDGDPLLAAVDMITDGKAGPLARVKGELGWLGDRIAYVSIPPMKDDDDHGVVATVKDAGDGIDAIGDVLGEKPREAKLAGRDARRFGSTPVYAAEVEGGYLVVGGRNLVRSVLSTAGGKERLARRASYTRAMRGRTRQLTSVFLDVEKAVTLSARAKRVLTYNLGARALDEPYVYGIDVADDTVSFDQLGGGTELEGVGVTALAKEAPSDAWAVLGMVDLRENGTGLLSDLASLAETPELRPGSARRALRTIGVDLGRDLFGWMGDAVLWVAGKDVSSLRVGLLVEARRARGAEAILAKLRSLMGPVKGGPDAFTVPLEDGARLRATFDGEVVSLAFEGQRSTPARGKVLDGPLGEDVAPALKGADPGLLVDVKALTAFIERVGGKDDPDWKSTYRIIRPFSSLAGVRGPKGGPRLVGRIR